MSDSSTTDAIIAIEWDMFSSVHNAGGPASCQSQYDEFCIMRKSQFFVWSDEAMASYLGDLQTAQKERRNLMSEKYAFMMERTFPEEFAAIADRLPATNPETMALIDEIVALHVAWKDELVKRYPTIGGLGRPTRSSEDRMGMPSLETYMRCELRTYSPQTVALVHRQTLQHKEEGLNEATATLLAQVQLYGFSTLEDAESYHASLLH